MKSPSPIQLNPIPSLFRIGDTQYCLGDGDGGGAQPSSQCGSVGKVSIYKGGGGGGGGPLLS